VASQGGAQQGELRRLPHGGRARLLRRLTFPTPTRTGGFHHAYINHRFTACHWLLPISSHAQDIRSTNADKAKWLSIPEVHARLESAGYRNIEKIERESGSYEVKATDPGGPADEVVCASPYGAVIDQRQRDKYDSDYAKTISAIRLTATSGAAVMTAPKGRRSPCRRKMIDQES
jgi:hypothetical protein